MARPAYHGPTFFVLPTIRPKSVKSATAHYLADPFWRSLLQPEQSFACLSCASGKYSRSLLALYLGIRSTILVCASENWHTRRP